MEASKFSGPVHPRNCQRSQGHRTLSVESHDDLLFGEQFKKDSWLFRDLPVFEAGRDIYSEWSANLYFDGTKDLHHRFCNQEFATGGLGGLRLRARQKESNKSKRKGDHVGLLGNEQYFDVRQLFDDLGRYQAFLGIMKILRTES
jgi:hypothetical protein